LGGFFGVLLGLAVCFVQIKYQLARLGAETAILDAYPIKIEVVDVVIAFFTILVITLLSSIIPAVKASRVHIKDYL
jgi:lipoprotein-releasing system permease protein